MKHIRLALGLAALAFFGCGPEGPPPEYTPPAPATPAISYTVVKRLPHDPTAFTEGLYFHEGNLFESTGSPDNYEEAKSTFGIVDETSGKLQVKAELDKAYFGEGLATLGDKMYWLTYTTQVGFIYDAKTYRRIGQFNYSNPQGWGFTVHDNKLLMSDGTYNLTYLDPATLAPVKTLAVTKDGYGLDHINELEIINGFIYANVWMTNLIVKIDPSDGKVVGQLDLSELFDQEMKQNRRIGETNGIAYDPATDRILVTGKMWPNMFEIQFSH